MRISSTKTTYLRGGIYRLSTNLYLTSSDNGTTYLAYPGEEPVVSGGEVVTGFVPEGNGIYSAPVNTPTDLDLIIGGARQRVATSGIYHPADPYKSGWLVAQQMGSGPSTRQFRFNPADLPANAFTPRMKARTYNTWRWATDINEVASIDFATNTITLAADTDYAIDNGGTYQLMNNPAFIRNPGEFAYRESDKRLIVKPANPSTFESDGVVVPRLKMLIYGNNADDITIRGITFSDTRYGTYDGHAILMHYADRLRIGGCKFVNVSTGIILKHSKSNQIAGNSFNYLTGDGIGLAQGTESNRVYANTMKNIGLMKAAAGIFLYGSKYNTIAHNNISYSSRYAISAKNGTDVESQNIGNVIEYNRTSYTNLESADSGAIEMLGRSNIDTQSIIRHNHIENNYSVRTDSSGRFVQNDQCFGIYLDDMTNGVQVFGNYVKGGCWGWSSIFVHGGDNNTIENNFLIDPPQYAVSLSRNGQFNDRPYNIIIRKNIVSSSVSLPTYLKLYDVGSYSSNFNLLHNAGKFSGQDSASVLGDPQFVDRANGNYLLRATSPAFDLGIVDLEWSKMGLSGYESNPALPRFW